MGEKIVGGVKALNVWARRSLDGWGGDVRHNTEDDPPLVVHPAVDPPSCDDREGYSKAWQKQFWEDYGRVAGDDVTLAECERKQGIICRNIGAFSSSDWFRAYSKVRWSTTGNRRNSGGGWVELSAFRKQNVNMDMLWFQQVLKRGYVKILDASEMAVHAGAPHGHGLAH